MSRDSEHVKQICNVCADICEACVKECERYTDMDHCQDAHRHVENVLKNVVKCESN